MVLFLEKTASAGPDRGTVHTRLLQSLRFLLQTPQRTEGVRTAPVCKPLAFCLCCNYFPGADEDGP